MANYPSGAVIYDPERMEEILFLVQEGEVELYRLSPEGKEEVLGQLGPGHLFGEMALLGQGMYDTFARAKGDCLLGTIDGASLRGLLVAKPALALAILGAVGERLVEVEALLEDVTFKSVAARLAALLLRLMKKQGPVIAGFTHQELANTIGTYRETTTQTLGAFKRQGLIRIGRKRVEVLDPEGLRAIARK
jgi:CRP-like cAMP-binding protein